MHGVFSRASRLTRSSTPAVPDTPLAGDLSRRKISSKLPMAISPASSTRDLNKSRSVSPAGKAYQLLFIQIILNRVQTSQL